MPLVAAEGIWLGMMILPAFLPSIAVDRSMLMISLRSAQQDEGFGINQSRNHESLEPQDPCDGSMDSGKSIR